MLQKVLLLILLVSQPAFSEEKPSFSLWLKTFKAEAVENGISVSTANAMLRNAKLLNGVIKLDRAQPEFVTPFLSYLAKRVTPNQIIQGRTLLQTHADELGKVEQRYGVPATLLVAFWGMETHYGQVQGNYGLPSALATLAYDGRRSDFFKSQLLDAMRIVDAKHMSLKQLRGSWAGAFGHMQFMPSTFKLYAVDADGDGKVNLVQSLPDVFASAANYLNQVGWVKDQPAAVEVKLPDNFDHSQASLLNRKPVAEWQKLGVVPVREQVIPSAEAAAILLPQGWNGPAFMVLPNFDVVMDWNRSINYALSVVHLANNMTEDVLIEGGLDAEPETLSYQQMWAIQAKLNQLGYDCGDPDGFPGLRTQAAIRQYQASQKIPQDGYAGLGLYYRLFND